MTGFARGGIIGGADSGDDSIPAFLHPAEEYLTAAQVRAMTAAPTLDILIPSIPHRHAKLCELLEVLDAQMGLPGIAAIMWRDNLGVSYGAKSAGLLEASAADYVVFVDDDDLVAADYVPRVAAALATRPDYVGYPVGWTVNGNPMTPVLHSLSHPGWTTLADGTLARDITHKNPVRRELAMLAPWEGGYGADERWADAMRAAGAVKTEVLIDAPMYHYRFSTGDEFHTARQPAPEHEIYDLPEYWWLTAL